VCVCVYEIGSAGGWEKIIIKKKGNAKYLSYDGVPRAFSSAFTMTCTRATVDTMYKQHINIVRILYKENIRMARETVTIYIYIYMCVHRERHAD